MQKAFEVWASGAETPVRCRLPTCGHVAYLPAAKFSIFECPTCGDALPEQSGVASRDYVPKADLTWQGATCQKQGAFTQSYFNAGGARIEVLEDLVAALSSPKVPRLRLGTAPLWPQSQMPPAPENAFAVWRTASAGCAVDSGVIELPERGVLLLAGAGAHFHGTTFKGGVVMCAGARFSGSFRNCTFIFTAIYAVHGAAVSLRRCGVFHSHVGLTLSGQATSATLDSCTFRDCRTSIILEAGAAVAMSRCLVLRAEFGIIVNEAGSRAALEDCAVRGGFVGGVPFGDTGVAVRRGTAILRTCQLKNLYTAFYATRSRVELQGVQIVGSDRGVFVSRRSGALLRGCNIEMTTPELDDSVAIGASGNAGGIGCVSLQLERCTVRGRVAAARALAVDDGSAAAATLCHFACVSEAVSVGFNVEGVGGRATLEHCTAESQAVCMLIASPSTRLRLKGGRYEGALTACAAEDGAKLTATDCEFRAQDGQEWQTTGGSRKSVGVVAVAAAARAWLLRCRVHGGVIGVLVSQATVAAVNTNIHDVQTLFLPGPTHMRAGNLLLEGSGGTAYLCTSSRLTVRGGSVRRCVAGIEADTVDDESNTVALDGVELVDCVSGAFFGHPSRVDLARCVFRGLEGERQGAPGLEALRRAGEVRHCGQGSASLGLHCMHAEVQRCSIAGFPGAIEIPLPGAEVSVRNCAVTVSSDQGLGMLVRGNVAVEDCEFHSAGLTKEFGIAMEATARCAVRRCRFRNLAHAAIEVRGNASASVLESAVAGPCRYGIVVNNQGRVATQDCSIDDAEIAVSVVGSGGVFTAKRTALHANHTNVALPATPGQAGRRIVKLVDCVLAKAVTAVWAGDAAADVSIVRCTVAAKDTGVFVAGPVKARIKGGSISDCHTGVVVGAVINVQNVPCVVCGASGQTAMLSAVQAAVAGGSRGGGTAIARCTHDGAVAQLAMADCEVARCVLMGVHVNVLARLNACGVTARECGCGFWVDLEAGDSSFEGCAAVGCQIGARECGGVAPVSADLMVEAAAKALPIAGVEVVPM